MKYVLLSMLGTTDPVRGEHDGPMVHILRHYRPEAVYLFFTREITKHEETDRRYEKTFAYLREHWDGYAPERYDIHSDITDVHDIDVLDAPIHEAIRRVGTEHPEATILLNITSGTPQMQMILSQILMDMRYRTVGVQVSNPEKKSGTAQRTNAKTYDAELELECNEDELPGAENRCTEPRLYALRRKEQRRHVLALLRQRDFYTVTQLDAAMPEELMTLVRHLAERSMLHDREARRLDSGLKALPFPLYPYRQGDRSRYAPLCEYYLQMKNLVVQKHYTEFLLHMDPLVLRLQLALLDRRLKAERISSDMFIREEGIHLYFYPDLLGKAAPALYEAYGQWRLERGGEEKRTDVSTSLCDMLLKHYPPQQEERTARALFARYAELKALRNALAHTLRSASAEDIRDVCGESPEKLLGEIEMTLKLCYEACDPAIFSVYDKSIAYIEENY